MKLTVRESNRWYAVQHRDEFSSEAMREAMLRGEGLAGDFTLLHAPAPPFDQTWLAVWGNDEELLVGAALLDSRPIMSGEFLDDLEILLDPYNDRLGWFQFVIGAKAETPDDALVTSHLPYHDAHSTAFPEIHLRRIEQRVEDFSKLYGAWRCRWVFAWFAMDEVFRNGDACGFNVARYRPYLNEYSSWNYLGGNGGQDSSGCGSLYRTVAPLAISTESAVCEAGVLRIAGSGEAASLSWKLLDPRGDGLPFNAMVAGDSWEGTAAPTISGRYRLSASIPGRIVEPDYISIDLPSVERARTFCLSTTVDTPMSICMNHFTPARLNEQMGMLAGAGIRRIDWIEYGDFDSFWSNPKYLWHEHYPRSIAACGDLLTCAATQAHKHDLELFADIKVFDLAYDSFFTEPDGRSTIREIEERYSSAIPEIAAHQEWTVQANPAWVRHTTFPVARVRLYSEKPLPRIDPADVTVKASTDNAAYRPLSGFTVSQGTCDRPHTRWTPAGPVQEAGSVPNWYLEISGLQANEPFLAVEIAGDIKFTQRGFMFAEAWSADGTPTALTVATKGDAEKGFSFWKEWTAWANHNELLLNRRSWNASGIGLVFKEMTNISALPEPCYDGARGIWLGRLRRAFDAGADGVSIRTLCHHNGMDTYLKYAFAPVVLETFRSLYHREPAMTAEDYERIRRIRGEGYTEFLRDAKKLAASHGKKLALQFESGMEIPPNLHSRMQIHWDWQRWIDEGLLDEIYLKWWQAESTYIHTNLLPLARRHDIPVHLISFCMSVGMDIRSMELAKQVAVEAAAQGYAGFNYYEHRNIMEMNPAGKSYFKGIAGPAIRSAYEALQQPSISPISPISPI